MDAMDELDASYFQSETPDWVQDTDYWLQDSVYSYTPSLFSSPNNNNIGDIYPELEWDESYRDTVVSSASTASNLSNVVEDSDPIQTTTESPEASPFSLSPPTSPHTPSAKTPCPTTGVAKRRGGRPRFSKPSASARIPHHQVEQKYRDGLNSAIEQLRMSVPSTAQWEKTDPRASKATVLACAIDYIQEIEGERDKLVEKIDNMRAMI
ncbi:hypothetical protein EJ08DRAFT_703780 [Tothia fuscella]|uniref:BHLH domain-containing protein n=1 Tax=Tothia fuscella TaxID=1048955 RepID=A0A9P4TRV6_9PEZI|nr:hypothetical protein EJ08DRAFT_703780 [Tothia fuscella]